LPFATGAEASRCRSFATGAESSRCRCRSSFAAGAEASNRCHCRRRYHSLFAAVAEVSTPLSSLSVSPLAFIRPPSSLVIHIPLVIAHTPYPAHCHCVSPRRRSSSVIIAETVTPAPIVPLAYITYPYLVMPLDSFAKLDGNNYFEWKMLMEATLIRRGLMEYVDGTKTTPLGSPNSKAVKDFLRKQAEARAEIVLHVETSQLSHVRDRNPAVIWTTLETVHRARGFATRLMLRRKFIMLKKSNDMTMQAWIAHVRCVAFQLEEINVSISDEDLILVLTVGLSPSYENFIVTLDSTPPDELTLDYVIARLMNEEARQVHGRDTESNVEDALLSRTQHRPRVPLENITCFKCGEKGHYQSHCPKTQVAGLTVDDFAF
jgi:hypothetical protein